MLLGKINAIEKCAHCNWSLITLPVKVNVRFIVLLSLLDRSQGRVRGGKAGLLSADPKSHLGPAASILSGKIYAIKNCARFNWGLTTHPVEVNVRSIMLLSLFDSTQGRLRSGKAGQLTRNRFFQAR